MTIAEQKRIRMAGIADIPLIQTLIEAIWEPTYGPILAKDQIDYMLREIYNPAALHQQMESLGHTFLLLYLEDTPMGFASFSANPEDTATYKLHKIYLLPGYQGKGLGNFLINEVMERGRAAGAHWLYLNVNRYNPARSFYERIGFQIEREEDIAFGPYWMNDYVMRKAL